MASRILVTGLGLTTHLATGTPANWQSITRPKCQALRTVKVPGTLAGFARAQELAEQACVEALSDSGLWDGRALIDVDSEHIGCTVSASKPFLSDGAQLGRLMCGAPVVHCPDLVNRFVRERFGLRGESRNVIAACATGAYSIALGASWIEQGLCEVVLAGSVEPYPHQLIQAGFWQMGVMSSDGVTRPFDQRRSGFTFGEGAGVVVLESEEHFKRREKRTAVDVSGGRLSRQPLSFPPYAVLSAWALGADSHSAVAFNSNGAKIARVIDRALERGGISSRAIGHVNAHGTATRLNDWIETQALIKAFGSHADGLMISATKASTGHLLGASGSVEFILTVLALHHQFIPPTATLEENDPECPLDYTPLEGHSAAFDHALSLSFGFGGPIGALVVSR